MPLAVVVGFTHTTCCCNMCTRLWRFLFTILVYLTHLISLRITNSLRGSPNVYEKALGSFELSSEGLSDIETKNKKERAICLWKLTCTCFVFDFLPMVFHLFRGLCLRLTREKTHTHTDIHSNLLFFLLWYGKYFTNKLKPSGISLAHRWPDVYKTSRIFGVHPCYPLT